MTFHGWTTSTTSPSWKVDALVAQIAPARDCEGTTLGLTFGILKCLSFVLRTASTQRLNRWKPLDQVFRLFGWADFMERPFGRHLNLRIQLRGCHSNRVSLAQILGIEANEPNLGQPIVQLRVSRELVFEKNTVDRFLNFFWKKLGKNWRESKKRWSKRWYGDHRSYMGPLVQKSCWITNWHTAAGTAGKPFWQVLAVLYSATRTSTPTIFQQKLDMLRHGHGHPERESNMLKTSWVNSSNIPRAEDSNIIIIIQIYSNIFRQK